MREKDIAEHLLTRGLISVVLMTVWEGDVKSQNSIGRAWMID
jgi:hypothetical protein